jgi:hypothetical protein
LLLRKLSSILGPSVAEIAEDNFGKGMTLLFDKLPEDEFWNLLKQLTGNALIDGKKYNDEFMSDYMFTLLVCKEVLAHNFEDFFSPIQEALVDFMQRQATSKE